MRGVMVLMITAAAPMLSEEEDTLVAATLSPSPTLSAIDENSESEPTPEDDEEVVDYKTTPTQVDMNMVYYLPTELRAMDEEGEVAQLDLGPKNAIFEKPKEPVKHLKPLYVRGHINRASVSRMLVDGGAW